MPFLELDHVPDRRLDVGPAYLAAGANVADSDDSLAQVADLRDLELELGERPGQVSEELAQFLVSAIDRRLTLEHHLKRCMHLRLGVEFVEERFDVWAVEGVNPAG